MTLDLRDLSDRELLSKTDNVVRRLRRGSIVLLHHLNEIERRGLYLNLGYASLFAYCTGGLRLSESAAGRHVATARCLRRFPEIEGLLQKGEVNLSTVAMVSRLMTSQNKEKLLKRIRRKLQSEVQVIVAEYRPERAVRDRVRPVCVARVVVPSSSRSAELTPASSATPRSNGASPPAADVGSFFTPAAGKLGTKGDGVGRRVVDAGAQRVELTRQNKFEFAAGDAFMKKFEEMRALMASHRHTQPAFSDVFEAAMDAWLDKHSPSRRHALRTARREAQRAKDERSSLAGDAHRSPSGASRSTVLSYDERSAEAAARGRGVDDTRRSLSRRADRSHARKAVAGRGPTGGPGSKRLDQQSIHPDRRSRHIPAAVRDAVHAKHGARCSYVSPSGRHCGATQHLQIDHLTPFARGGGHEVENLRLLCAKHNRLEAERLLGRDVMARHRRE